MQVIGVAAQLANGKDVLCDYLVKKLNAKYDQQAIHDFRQAAEVISKAYPQTALKNLSDEEILARNVTVRNSYPDARRWQRSAFANAVKEVYESAFGVNRDFVESWKRNPEPPPGFTKNVRQSLQFIGDGFRQIKGDIWIDIALRDEAKKLIISDSRYINEAKAIRAKGGLMVVLYRPGFLNDDPNPSESQIRPIVEWCDKYQSDGPIMMEVPLAGANSMPEGMEYYDFFLRNDGTLEDLYNKVDGLLVPYIEERYAAECQ
jgi:hypothetical protein